MPLSSTQKAHQNEEQGLQVPDSSQVRATTELVPARAATFKGSFAAQKRQDDEQPVLQRVGMRKAIWLYFTVGWGEWAIWKSAFVELVASMSLCYLSAFIDTTITNFNTSQFPAYAGITNLVLISLFIYAIAPASGGHLNPFITFTTITTGLTGFPRGILYMVGQTIGGCIAGGLIRGSLGKAMTQKYHGGGCFIATDQISTGQAYLIESVSSFILIFIAFGVGLDPRQAELFGPVIGPFMVGATLGLVSFASAGIIPGYTGAGMNPARCLGLAVARGNFQDQWIWWVGPLTGALLQTAAYKAAPPYHSSPKTDRPRDHSQNSKETPTKQHYQF